MLEGLRAISETEPFRDRAEEGQFLEVVAHLFEEEVVLLSQAAEFFLLTKVAAAQIDQPYENLRAFGHNARGRGRIVA